MRLLAKRSLMRVRACLLGSRAPATLCSPCNARYSTTAITSQTRLINASEDGHTSEWQRILGCGRHEPKESTSRLGGSYSKKLGDRKARGLFCVFLPRLDSLA